MTNTNTPMAWVLIAHPIGEDNDHTWAIVGETEDAAWAAALECATYDESEPYDRDRFCEEYHVIVGQQPIVS